MPARACEQVAILRAADSRGLRSRLLSQRDAACGVARRRDTPLARCWLRRPAVHPARSVRAGWAQTLARGAPRRPRHAARRHVAQAVSLLDCVTAELIAQSRRDLHGIRVVLTRREAGEE